MKILLTNDDGYEAKGLKELVEMMRPYGDITVVAPKFHQSGMSMAVGLGYKPIAVKKISEKKGESWWYVDDTPASCVKFAVDNIFLDGKPDVVISGINHGANTASAVLYSATIGAAQEGAMADILSIGVSLDDFGDDPDFSPARKYFPGIFEKLVSDAPGRFGIYYNINIPAIAPDSIKGIKVCHQGIEHWENEFQPYDSDIFRKKGIRPIDRGIRFFPEIEEGETVYMMVGDVVEDARNVAPADQRLVAEGYISIVAHNLDTTDYPEIRRLESMGLNESFL